MWRTVDSIWIPVPLADSRLKCIKCITDTAFGWYTGERISWFMMPSRTRGMGDMLLTHLEMVRLLLIRSRSQLRTGALRLIQKHSLAHCNANSMRVV